MTDIKTERAFLQRLLDEAGEAAIDRADMLAMLTARFRACLPEEMLKGFNLYSISSPMEVYVICFRFGKQIYQLSMEAEDLLYPRAWRKIEHCVHDFYHMYYRADGCQLCL